MMFFRLALRNLMRQKRRTFLTFAAIAGGLTLMVWSIHLNRGSYDSLLRNGISELAGHVVVQAPGWQDERETKLVVADATLVADAIRGEFPEATVTTRVLVDGLLTSSRGSAGAGLIGLVPTAEARVTRREDQVSEGAYLADDDEQGILLGASLARTLAVGVGDKVVYMGQPPGQPEMVSRLFRVRGLLKTGAPELDAFTALVHVNAAQELLGRGDVAHQVALHLGDARLAEAAAERVRAKVPAGTEVLDWHAAIPQIDGMIKVDARTNDALMSVIGLIVAMGMLNTLLMSVLERTREFGVMLAIGMKPGLLARVVLTEALILGVAGVTTGAVLGSLLAWPTIVYGLDLSGMVGDEGMSTGGIGVDLVLYGAWDFPRVANYALVGVLFTVLAAAWPAWRVSRMTPVEGMRHT
jgi:ABC-type lipoprotein release transport system permease subunit